MSVGLIISSPKAHSPESASDVLGRVSGNGTATALVPKDRRVSEVDSHNSPAVRNDGSLAGKRRVEPFTLFHVRREQVLRAMREEVET